MRKRVKVAVSVLLVALAGAVVWELLRPPEREPVYQGKGLRVWLHEARGSERASVAEAAARHLGVNAIPTMLDMLREKDSSLAPRLMRFWNRHVARIRWLPNWFRYPPWYRLKIQAGESNTDAAEGFFVLGPDAKQAVPDLIRIYEQSISPSSQRATSLALGFIGPAARGAIPSLLRGTASSDPSVRCFAFWALSRVHAEPSLVFPVLAKFLSDTNLAVREAAAKSLGECGTQAGQAVQMLAPLLNDSVQAVREAATNALLKIDTEAAAKAGVRQAAW